MGDSPRSSRLGGRLPLRGAAARTVEMAGHFGTLTMERCLSTLMARLSTQGVGLCRGCVYLKT